MYGKQNKNLLLNLLALLLSQGGEFACACIKG